MRTFFGCHKVNLSKHTFVSVFNKPIIRPFRNKCQEDKAASARIFSRIVAKGREEVRQDHEDPGNKKAHPLLTDAPERVKIECDLWQLLRKNSQI
jgi:hypothetical protein